MGGSIKFNNNMNTKPIVLTQLALAATTALIADTASAQTWQTVDDFQYVAGAGATGLTLDPLGNLFVAGYGKDANSVFHALIQKSADGGATWSTADDFTTAPDLRFTAEALGTARVGELPRIRQAICTELAVTVLATATCGLPHKA